jgi:short-subunit dehydrogenase involved in D-alanine esterification of teichoic acids
VAADVADSAAVEAMVAHTEAELGPVTILVNNAGVSWQGTLDTYDREQVARMHQVNVDGVIHATRAVIGSMRAQRYGRIVNVASIAGIGTALSGNAFYAATKAEVLVLTRRFALELGQHGITVNAVAPGFVRTELTQRGRGAADWPGTEQRFAQRAMNSKLFVKTKNNLARDTKALRDGMGAIRRMHISSPRAPIGGTDCHDMNRQRVAGCRRIGGMSQRICRRPCTQHIRCPLWVGSPPSQLQPSRQEPSSSSPWWSATQHVRSFHALWLVGEALPPLADLRPASIGLPKNGDDGRIGEARRITFAVINVTDNV